MATIYPLPHPAAPVPDSSPHLGVFFYSDPTNTDDANADLVHTAPDFNSAYEQMREHAMDEAGQRPEWGRIEEETSPKTYNILGRDGQVRISYEIAIIHPADPNTNGNPTWMRQTSWLAHDFLDCPDEAYGMFIDVDTVDKKASKQFLVGGFTTLGEANNAMKQSAIAYLAETEGVRLLERTIELVGPEGEVRQRYQVFKGRWKSGKFMKEEAWLNMEAQLQKQKAYSSPSSTDNGNTGRSSIVRLPDNDSSPTPSMSAAGESVPAGPSRSPTPAQAGPAERPTHPQVVIPARAPSPTPGADEDANMTGDHGEEGLELWCTCRGRDDGSLMIFCDNGDCAIQWYHGHCLGMTEAPEGTWLCPRCAPESEPPLKRRRTMSSKDVKKTATRTGAKGKAAAGGKRKSGGKRR